MKQIQTFATDKEANSFIDKSAADRASGFRVVSIFEKADKKIAVVYNVNKIQKVDREEEE